MGPLSPSKAWAAPEVAPQPSPARAASLSAAASAAAGPARAPRGPRRREGPRALGVWPAPPEGWAASLAPHAAASAGAEAAVPGAFAAGRAGPSSRAAGPRTWLLRRAGWGGRRPRGCTSQVAHSWERLTDGAGRSLEARGLRLLGRGRRRAQNWGSRERAPEGGRRLRSRSEGAATVPPQGRLAAPSSPKPCPGPPRSFPLPLSGTNL